MMRVIFLGDVVGRAGREAVTHYLPELKAKLSPHLIFVNVENAAAGFGVTPNIAKDFFDSGIHAMTTGNHVFDQRSILAYFSEEKRLLRPMNYPHGTGGHGFCRLELPYGHIFLVNLSCRLFMGESIDCPFQAIDQFLKAHPLGQNGLKGIFIDLHGEATSEKQALAYFVDGRASLVVGTHTHVPTSDYRIQANGTGYVSDLGMCGDYDSVLGMKKDVPLSRFLDKGPGKKLVVSLGEATICGLYATFDRHTGLAKACAPICLGPHLTNRLPEP